MTGAAQRRAAAGRRAGEREPLARRGRCGQRPRVNNDSLTASDLGAGRRGSPPRPLQGLGALIDGAIDAHLALYKQLVDLALAKAEQPGPSSWPASRRMPSILFSAIPGSGA